MVNKAIALQSNQTDFDASEVSLAVTKEISFDKIPPLPQHYIDYFDDFYESTSDQSFFQEKIPIVFQKHEFIQEWFKNKTISDILNRLSKSKPKKMESSLAEKLGFR